MVLESHLHVLIQANYPINTHTEITGVGQGEEKGRPIRQEKGGL